MTKHLLYPEEVKTLFINRVLCLHCNDIITSKFTDDYVSCKCSKIAISGGQDYRRRKGEEGKDYEELSVWKPMTKKEVKKELKQKGWVEGTIFEEE